MPGLRRKWASIILVTVIVCLNTVQSSDNPSRPELHASRALDTSLPLHQMFSQSIDLATLNHLFPQDHYETNELDMKPSTPKAPNPPKFDINTFTFNKKNIRKPGDIFSLLADVEEAKTKGDKGNDKGKIGVSKQGVEASDGSEDDKIDSEGIFNIPGINMANLFGKNVLLAAKELESLLGVVQKMKSKVESKLPNSTLSDSAKITTNTTQHLVSILLNTTKLEEIRTASLTAQSEDEFLDHLAEVLAGDETRSGGHALTLDPVTIIALLTLAAYLIRAVYQILTVTGRSLDDDTFMLPLQLSDMPQAMVLLHNWISDTQFNTHVREERSLPYVTTVLDIPGNLAAIIKLHREGHQPCVRQFLCEKMQDRTFPEITLTDLFIGWRMEGGGEGTRGNLARNSNSGVEPPGGSRRVECRSGSAPGLGGLAARNLEESDAVEVEARRDRRSVEERVWEHFESLNFSRHMPGPVALPHTISSWSLPNDERMRRGVEGQRLLGSEGVGSRLGSGVGGGVVIGGVDGGVRGYYQTTGGDYGRFPRGSEVLARPPVSHTLPTKFTHHLASAGMFRNHSLNM